MYHVREGEGMTHYYIIENDRIIERAKSLEEAKEWIRNRQSILCTIGKNQWYIMKGGEE